MSQFDGRNIHYGIGRGATPDFWINRTGGRIYKENEKIENESSYGTQHRISQMHEERVWSEGQLEGKVNSDYFGLILFSTHGEVSSSTTSDTAGTVTKHTFTMYEGVEVPTVNIWRKDPVSGENLFGGSVLDNLQISGELGGYVTWTADHLGGESETASSLSPSYTLDPEFRVSGAELYLEETEGDLSGATKIATIQSFSLNINRNMDRDHEAGEKAPSSITTNDHEAEAQMTLRWTDSAYENLQFGDDTRAMRIKLTNNETIGDSSNPEITFTLPSVAVSNWETSEDLGSRVEQTITATVLADLEGGSAVTTELVNTVNNYSA